MNGAIDEKTIDPLYLRASNILVRPGNPHHIGGLRSLLRPGFKVMVVQGAGQTGLWEDMAGRAGDIAPVRALPANNVSYACSTAEPIPAWTSHPTIHAWSIWEYGRAAARGRVAEDV